MLFSSMFPADVEYAGCLAEQVYHNMVHNYFTHIIYQPF